MSMDKIDRYNREVEEYNKKWDEIAELFIEIGKKIQAINDKEHDNLCEGMMCFCQARRKQDESKVRT